MSSDSDDDSYSKIAQKLQSMKSNYQEDKTKPTSLLEDSFDLTENLTTDNQFPEIDLKQTNFNVDRQTKELTLDSIIEQNSSKSKTRGGGRGRGRGRKRKSDDEVFIPDEPVGRVRRRTSKRKTQERDRLVAHVDEVLSELSRAASVDDTFTSPARGSAPSRRRGRAQGPGRGRGRGSGRSPARAQGSGRSPGHGGVVWAPARNGRRGKRRYTPSQSDSAIFNFFHYNIGNTDEYEDLSEQQDLFSSDAANVVVLDDDTNNDNVNDPLDENEELNVKVYWQSSEIYKFTIRQYQKFTQMYDYFATKENVSKEKLLFTYNDKMLSADDTPDTIKYNICKFIDGGIVNQSLSPLKKKQKEDVIVNGIKLKFQCQNVRKPCEIVIEAEDKMSLAFMKCAEHFEKPIDKLKFYFDGDLISGKNTPKDLELEGGECIDVVIIS